MVGLEKYKAINEILNRKLEDQPFLIVTHKGCPGGNIVENTMSSKIVAFKSGSDIVELDVSKSTDGKFYIFHDGEEKRLLKHDCNLNNTDSVEIEKLKCFNRLGHPVKAKVLQVKDLLESIKGDELINIDRSWWHWDSFLDYLDNFNKEKNIILKSPVTKEYLDMLEKHPVKYMYFPIPCKPQDFELCFQYKNINFVGIEVHAEKEKDFMYQDDFLKSLRDSGLFIYVNAIVLSDSRLLYAGLDDDVSILDSPSKGWGKIVNKYGNVIQTDWPGLLNEYRKTLSH